ncbi:uncharacterized protein LTR77_009690 [Saxophila tyrrhenica]|uniref:Peptidase A2 domain-containing protein n=1 Tax=Saxophila tyrrhenica TaxID=1690608 RepID=A0AAV9NX41_9PEZI|nr:hypothetical protein LTR77_009690 [Saxophila tyrrhenica]
MPSCRVRYLGAPQQLVSGSLEGKPVYALPDTGSDLMLISEAYATSNGFVIDTAFEHQKDLQFADGSSGRTSGVVHNLKWSYDDSKEEVSKVDFYVLDGLECDVLLSYDLLGETQAYTKHESTFIERDVVVILQDQKPFNTIAIRSEQSIAQKFRSRLSKRKKLDGQQAHTLEDLKSSGTAPMDAKAWGESRRRLLQRKEESELSLSKLPLADHQAALDTFKAIWEADWTRLISRGPVEMQHSDGGGTSS